jgi:hypothetical protein
MIIIKNEAQRPWILVAGKKSKPAMNNSRTGSAQDTRAA